MIRLGKTHNSSCGVVRRVCQSSRKSYLLRKSAVESLCSYFHAVSIFFYGDGVEDIRVVFRVPCPTTYSMMTPACSFGSPIGPARIVTSVSGGSVYAPGQARYILI